MPRFFQFWPSAHFLVISGTLFWLSCTYLREPSDSDSDRHTFARQNDTFPHLHELASSNCGWLDSGVKSLSRGPLILVLWP